MIMTTKRERQHFPQGQRPESDPFVTRWTDRQGIQRAHETPRIREVTALRKRLKREGLEVFVGRRAAVQWHQPESGAAEAMRRMAGASDGE